MQTDQHALTQQRLAYVTLTGILLALVTALGLRRPKRNVTLGLREVVVLGLAAFRLGRLVSYDRVMEPLRSPFTQTVPDPTGAGESVEPKGTGWRRSVGELISCPICSGTWMAAALLYGLEFAPGPTRVLMAIMSAMGLSELLDSLVEWLCWNAQAARRQTGSKS